MFTVKGCYVADYTMNGIMLLNSSDCLVDGNTGLDANAGAIDQGADIAVLGASLRNIVSNNRCLGPTNAHSGIILVINGTDLPHYNIIVGNQISQHKRYGIVVYGGSDYTQAIYGTVISDNIIKDILGLDMADGHKQFGAGIYAAYTEFTTITGNYIENTNVNTDYELLAPGAIGWNGGSNGIIANNTIYNPQWFGVYIIDAGQGGLGSNPGSENYEPYGSLIVEGNNIYGPLKPGIRIKAKHNVKVRGNSIYFGTGTGTDAGIEVLWGTNYSTLKNIEISGNFVQGGYRGITPYYLLRGAICNNVCRNQTHDGIFVFGANSLKIDGNEVSGAGYLGLYVDATSTKFSLNHNYIHDCLWGIDLEALPNRFGSGNRVENNSSGDKGGTYWFVNTAPANSATPSVKGSLALKTNNNQATTITMLNDGYVGQVVTVIFGDANTTVDLTGTHLKGNGGADWSPGVGDTMTCTFDGTDWYCVVNNTS